MCPGCRGGWAHLRIVSPARPLRHCNRPPLLRLRLRLLLLLLRLPLLPRRRWLRLLLRFRRRPFPGSL